MFDLDLNGVGHFARVAPMTCETAHATRIETLDPEKDWITNFGWIAITWINPMKGGFS